MCPLYLDCSQARRPTHAPKNPTKGTSRTSRIRRARVCERSKQQDASRTPYAETRPRTGLETRGTGPGCQESRRTTGPLRRGQPPSSPGPDGHAWGAGAHKPARLGRPERHDGPDTYWNAAWPDGHAAGRPATPQGVRPRVRRAVAAMRRPLGRFLARRTRRGRNLHLAPVGLPVKLKTKGGPQEM